MTNVATAPTACCLPLDAPTLSEEDARATAALFKALADPARVRIVNALARSDRPVCACDFEPALGLSQPTVSHHLKKLTDAGLLEREQRGRWAYFSLRRETLDTLAAVTDLQRSVQNDASSAGRSGRARCKDAGSANSTAIGATEDAAAGRPGRPDGTTLHSEMSA